MSYTNLVFSRSKMDENNCVIFQAWWDYCQISWSWQIEPKINGYKLFVCSDQLLFRLSTVGNGRQLATIMNFIKFRQIQDRHWSMRQKISKKILTKFASKLVFCIQTTFESIYQLFINAITMFFYWKNSYIWCEFDYYIRKNLV